MELTYEAVASRLEHALLGPTLTEVDLDAGCQLAARYHVAGVCIKPFAVPLAVRLLDGTGLGVTTVVGFPHGGQAPAVKRYEVARALEDGARGVELVVNIGQVLGGAWDEVRDELAAFVEAAHAGAARATVIFETCYLSPAEIVRLCRLCGEAGADAACTSTGYGSRGASTEDLRLMREVAPPGLALKAAGGLRTLDQALAALRLGCDRVATGRTARLLDELAARLGVTAPTNGSPPA
jgi:deoxyribose-phosphate aldolase